MPFAFELPALRLMRAPGSDGDYVDAVRDTIRLGGRNASRAMVVGACLAALAAANGVEDIVPLEWISTLVHGEQLVKLAKALVGLRASK